MSSVVSVSNLTVAYRGRRGPRAAVRNLSFRIDPGEPYGLVGESGSGKSTAAMALTRFLPMNAELSADSLTIAGEDVLSLDPYALRRFRASKIAVVYQEPGLALNPTMPAGRQIEEVFRIHGIDRREAHERTLQAIEHVRLAPADVIAKRFPHELSGGQQQRIVIAMALATDPQVLILDEPTTALDASVEAGIMELIDNLQGELGFASLLISHNLPLIAAHCKRMGVLQHGLLVEEGAASQVLKSPSHPYTRALIAALPNISAKRERSSLVAKVAEPGGLDSTAAGSLVTITDLSKDYNHKPALKDVSLTIGQGEVLGIVGESGSGKSTLGRCIAGLTGYNGSIEFHVEERHRGRMPLPFVQVVFQNADLSLNPRRTVRQVLSRAVELLMGNQTAEELADQVGLSPDLLDKLPAQLSGGQKQRVAIARAFAGQVPLVICDEPTSALDVSIQARILDLLVELQERTGVSYLFISHDLAVVRQIAHRIGVLYDGELVELRPAEEIFEAAEHPHSRALVESALALRRVAA